MNRYIVSILIFSLCLFGAYQKNIIIDEPIVKPSLVELKIDNEIYKYTHNKIDDIRLLNNTKEIGYFTKYKIPKIENIKVLPTSKYTRTPKVELTYLFPKAFDIEYIGLNISDRNFETYVDVYANDKLIKSHTKIFDYSNETGNQNFVIRIPKTKATKISIKYNAKNTKFFFRKYVNIQEHIKYLTIKSVTFKNYISLKQKFDITDIPLLSHEYKDSHFEYIFESDFVSSRYIEVVSSELNYHRKGTLYSSDDNISWRYIKSFDIKASSFDNTKQNKFSLTNTGKLIKLVFNEETPISAIKIYTAPLYFDFIAEANTSYHIEFGDDNQSRLRSDIASLIPSSTKAIQARFSALITSKTVQPQISFFEQYKNIIFIVLLLLAVLILGYVAFILLSTANKEEQ